MDIEAVKGDTEYYDISAIRSNAPINLTGSNVKAWFTAKRTKDDLDDDALIALNSTDHSTQIVFTARPQGQFSICLLPANTTEIEEDTLVYDIQVREEDGRITTIQSGKLHLKQDITRQVA
jgi:hypothetical protein